MYVKEGDKEGEGKRRDYSLNADNIKTPLLLTAIAVAVFHHVFQISEI